ncbi:MAG: response regulator [Deltaproteobacteria bacterium]|nr:response regulator [Deltaproteobacteria bacterium]
MNPLENNQSRNPQADGADRPTASAGETGSMLSLSLRNKFIIGTVCLILLVGAALAILVGYELHSRFKDELHKRGLSTARYIAEASEIPLITENSESIRMLVNDYRKVDRDIEYIYIVNPTGGIVTHTFGSVIPDDLIRQVHAEKGQPGQLTALSSENGTIYDISVQIQAGALGTVHIGLYESVIKKNVHGVLMRMLPFVLFILVLGIIAAIIFASAITRPIALLTQGVQRFSKGELDEAISISAGDEIGQLASAFNIMTDNLRSTTVSREFMEKLIDSMNDVLIVISPEGVIQSVNRAYCELFGYSSEDIVGRRVDEFEEKDAPLCMYAALEHALDDGRVHGIESNCRKSSGELVTMLYSLAVMKDDEGKPQAIICAAQDISDLKKVQDALHRKQLEMEEINRNLEEIVASRTAELAIGNEGLRAEVAERQKKTEELRAARDAAESANRSKSEFLANMSHEMRTPLNSIIGGTDFLDSANLSPDQQRCLTMIRQAGDGLLVLVNDLIDLSRIEAGQLEIINRQFNLPDTLERIAQMMGLEADRKKLELKLIIAPDIPHFLIGDHIRLQQVLVNLVSNAIKFTDSGGTVSLSALSRPESEGFVPVTFVIRDSGIGLDPDKLEMIFESFSQADASITRRFGGSGLGLAISRKLVEAMGGYIQVESSPGTGSSFSFTIAFHLAESPVENRHKPHADSAETQASEMSLQHEGTKRVLLVDDSVENRELMRLLLLKFPLVMDEAGNGKEAVKLFERNSYDLIFMDIQMPIMDGYTATRMIRTNEERSGRHRTVIVALTAHAYESDIRKCLEAGCDDHIAKPFKKKTLMQCLANHLRGIRYE